MSDSPNQHASNLRWLRHGLVVIVFLAVVGFSMLVHYQTTSPSFRSWDPITTTSHFGFPFEHLELEDVDLNGFADHPALKKASITGYMKYNWHWENVAINLLVSLLVVWAVAVQVYRYPKLRFGIRSMLIATVLVAIPLSDVFIRYRRSWDLEDTISQSVSVYEYVDDKPHYLTQVLRATGSPELYFWQPKDLNVDSTDGLMQVAQQQHQLTCATILHVDIPSLESHSLREALSDQFLSRLEYLSLNGCEKIDDGFFLCKPKFTNLKSLYLCDTSITKATIDSLVDLPNLETLWISLDLRAGEAMRRLRQRKPDLDVTFGTHSDPFVDKP